MGPLDLSDPRRAELKKALNILVKKDAPAPKENAGGATFTQADLDRIRAKPVAERTQAEVDAANAFSRAKTAAAKVETDATAAAAQAVRDDVDGFADGLDSMRAARVRKTLNGPIRRGGKVVSRKELVRELVAAGHEVRTVNGERRFVGPDGTWLEEKTVSKTALDYAEHLIARKPAAVEPATTAASAPDVDAAAQVYKAAFVKAYGAERGLPDAHYRDNAARVLNAIVARDVGDLRSLNFGDPTAAAAGRAVFEAQTGIMLPKGKQATLDALDAWAGITAEQRAQEKAAKQTEKAAKAKARREVPTSRASATAKISCAIEPTPSVASPPTARRPSTPTTSRSTTPPLSSTTLA